jgi:carbamoyltransferase
MKILGISAGFHDAAATLIHNGDILFAGHSERYSKQKNDANIHSGLLQDALAYSIDHIAYYERPWLKQLRQWYAGQGIEWDKVTLNQVLQQQVPEAMLYLPTTSTHNHHACHAAAGFQTSPYDRATVVVIDAVGEFDTITIWGAEYDKNGHATYKILWTQRYPH